MLPKVGIRLIIAATAALVVLIGCSQPASSDIPTSQIVSQPPGESNSTPRLLPTLYPTSTMHPTALPTETRPPLTAAPSSTPINFDQLVVDLRYEIPSLGLKRSISGDVAGRMKLTDETIDFTVDRNSQAGILLEMQQSLAGLKLDDLPEGCNGCVRLEYELPLTGESDQGWLQDERMLVSLENYTSIALGPHFPPGTIFGIRRSSAEFHDAHSAAVTEDGRLWLWNAMEAEVPEAVSLDEVDPIYSVDIDALDLTALESLYIAECPENPGIETLFIQDGDVERFIDISCPEIALPLSLLPLYLSLDAKTVGIRDLYAPEDYEPPAALETVLIYQNQDENKLTVYHDGSLIADDGAGNVISDTIPLSTVISMTSQLSDSGLTQPGIDAYLAGVAENYLVIRGENGLSEIVWADQAPSLITPIVDRLDLILANLLGGEEQGSGGDSEAEPVTTQTPESTPAASITPTPGE
jgi:hypothetical protein